MSIVNQWGDTLIELDWLDIRQFWDASVLLPGDGKWVASLAAASLCTSGNPFFSFRRVAFSSLQGIPFNWCQVLTLVGQGYQTSRCLFLWFCGWNAAWLKRTVWGYLFCLCTVPASFTDTLPRLRSWRFGRDEEAQFCLFCSINCMSAIVI